MHFKEWLRKHRGASDATIRLYARDASRLAAALGDDPEGWEPAAIRSFFLDCASRCGEGTVEKLTTSLRAFLRYLAVEGRCRAGLADVVPGARAKDLAGRAQAKYADSDYAARAAGLVYKMEQQIPIYGNDRD